MPDPGLRPGGREPRDVLALLYSARMQIRKGKTTWQQLEELGLSKPGKGGAFGAEPSIFRTALEKALAERG